MAKPMDKGAVKMKGEKPKAKPEATTSKAEQAKPTATAKTERGKLEFSEAEIVAAVKSVGHAASSREISDKLGIKDPEQGRGWVRGRMIQLVKDGKIKTSKPDGKSRCMFLYSVA